ncbi:MAG: hypothetical protein WAL14_17955, partial [Pseudolabrys sp.]
QLVHASSAQLPPKIAIPSKSAVRASPYLALVQMGRQSKLDMEAHLLVLNRGTFSSGHDCTVGVASQGATNCGQRLPEAS